MKEQKKTKYNTNINASKITEISKYTKFNDELSIFVKKPEPTKKRKKESEFVFTFYWIKMCLDYILASTKANPRFFKISVISTFILIFFLTLFLQILHITPIISLSICENQIG